MLGGECLDRATIPAEELGAEQPVVGLAEELERRHAVVRHRGPPEAHVVSLRRQKSAKARAELRRAVESPVREHAELVAADARDLAARTDRRANDLPDGAQHA